MDEVIGRRKVEFDQLHVQITTRLTQILHSLTAEP